MSRNQDYFLPSRVFKIVYGTIATDGFFAFTGIDSEENHLVDKELWKYEIANAVGKWETFVNDGEAIYLAIKGQTEPTV